MAKYCGNIGFVKTVDNGYGEWLPEVTEKQYYGDITRNYRRWDTPDKVNGDVTLSNTFSVIGDVFAYDNIGYMKYLTYLGQKWNINGVDLSTYPRIMITVGGLYNED